MSRKRKRTDQQGQQLEEEDDEQAQHHDSLPCGTLGRHPCAALRHAACQGAFSLVAFKWAKGDDMSKGISFDELLHIAARFPNLEMFAVRLCRLERPLEQWKQQI